MSADTPPPVPPTVPRVIVIGISSRLGMATARELARRGARVAGTFFMGEARASSLAKELEQLSHSGQASQATLLARRLDLRETHDIERVVNELATEMGGCDVLVHCASVASAAVDADKYDRLIDVDPASFATMLTINVTSALLCARAFANVPVPPVPAAGSARRSIVFVGSIDGAKSVPTVVPYATSKGAVVAMARALAKELSPSGILVNVVAPGLLESGITQIVPEDVKREYLKHCSLKRFGTHEEIARSIAWLSLENTYVTGQTMVLDGGL